jgi:hypothetical protein
MKPPGRSRAMTGAGRSPQGEPDRRVIGDGAPMHLLLGPRRVDLSRGQECADILRRDHVIELAGPVFGTEDGASLSSPQPMERQLQHVATATRAATVGCHPAAAHELTHASSGHFLREDEVRALLTTYALRPRLGPTPWAGPVRGQGRAATSTTPGDSPSRARQTLLIPQIW